jgi:hypothetical protein
VGVLFGASLTSAQNVDCGTRLSPSDSTWVRSLPWFGNNGYLLGLLSFVNESRKSETLTATACGGTTTANFRVPIQATIVQSDDSLGSATPAQVDSIIKLLNQLYWVNQTDIQFYQICEPKYLYNTTYSQNLADLNASLQMFSLVDTDGAIDVFFLDSASLGVNGYARFPANTYPLHTWVLTNRPTLSDVTETLAHEIGHTLNLLHTYEGSFCRDWPSPTFFNYECGECGQESVSRTRGQGAPCDFIGFLKCEVNGDLLCDTPGDPVLIQNDNLSICAFSPVSSTNRLNRDHWGDTWAPDETNFMSSATGCRSTFTPMQTAILIGSVTSYIPNFFPRVENDFDVFEPDNYPETATLLPIGDVQCHTFHWSPLSPNEFSACDSDWYRVEVPAGGSLAIKTFAVPGQPEPDTYLELFDSHQRQPARI